MATKLSGSFRFRLAADLLADLKKIANAEETTVGRLLREAARNLVQGRKRRHS